MTYQHNGVTIEFHEATGLFTATIGGKALRKSSLVAMKKAITAALAKPFEPFDAFLMPSWSEKGIRFGRVTGLERTANRRHGAMYEWVFVPKNKGISMRVNAVYVDTPENREAALAFLKFEEEENKRSILSLKRKSELQSLILLRRADRPDEVVPSR